MTSTLPEDMRESEQIEAMKQLGFSVVAEVYGLSYAKEIAEYPPHLTNGKSFLQLTKNQAAELLRIIQARVKETGRKAREEAEITLARKVLAVSGGHHKIKGFTQAKRLKLLTDEMNKIIPDEFGVVEQSIIDTSSSPSKENTTMCQFCGMILPDTFEISNHKAENHISSEGSK